MTKRYLQVPEGPTTLVTILGCVAITVLLHVAVSALIVHSAHDVQNGLLVWGGVGWLAAGFMIAAAVLGGAKEVDVEEEEETNYRTETPQP